MVVWHARVGGNVSNTFGRRIGQSHTYHTFAVRQQATRLLALGKRIRTGKITHIRMEFFFKPGLKTLKAFNALWLGDATQNKAKAACLGFNSCFQTGSVHFCLINLVFKIEIANSDVILVENRPVAFDRSNHNWRGKFNLKSNRQPPGATLVGILNFLVTPMSRSTDVFI